MSKHQFHDEFTSFTGKTIDEISKQISDFSVQHNYAVKSLSILFLPVSNTLAASIGFRSDEAAYPVSVWATPVNAATINGDLSDAENKAPGDVLCHSLYYVPGAPTPTLYAAFLLHE